MTCRVKNGGRDTIVKRQSKNYIMSNTHLECLTAVPAQQGEDTATARVYMITRCADQVSMTVHGCHSIYEVEPRANGKCH
jgi:hypothetical protein